MCVIRAGQFAKIGIISFAIQKVSGRKQILTMLNNSQNEKPHLPSLGPADAGMAECVVATAAKFLSKPLTL